jgi:hypothetical protein
LKTSSALATMAADAGDTREALPHLERCRQIISAGKAWFGIAAMVERADAIVAAAQGEHAAAEDRFQKTIATLQQYCLPWEKPIPFNTGAAHCSPPASAHSHRKVRRRDRNLPFARRRHAICRIRNG